MEYSLATGDLLFREQNLKKILRRKLAFHTVLPSGVLVLGLVSSDHTTRCAVFASSSQACFLKLSGFSHHSKIGISDAGALHLRASFLLSSQPANQVSREVTACQTSSAMSGGIARGRLAEVSKLLAFWHCSQCPSFAAFWHC